MNIGSPDKASIAPAVIRFAMAFVLCLAVVYLATALFRFDVPGSMGVVTLVVALAPAFDVFVRATGRVMTSGEKLRFSASAAVIALLVNVAALLIQAYATFGFVSFGSLAAMLGLGRAKLDLSIVAIGLAGALVIAFVLTYASAGFMARGALKRLAKAK
ncbi:MAG: ABZJ_00895 family protein [Phreatobacter sp.]